MVLIQFFSRGGFPSPKISLFYIGVLLIYSLHKEAIRWLGEREIEKRQRNGEYFVGLWIIITTLLYFLNFLTKDYFRYSEKGAALSALEDISFITLEVLAVFIFTRLLKIGTIYLLSRKK